jgi:hypothetical protein
MQDQAFMDAISEFEASGLTAAAAATAPDICAIYKKVKPILNGILPFIKLIPVFGATAAAAITALMAVLDGVCAGKL